MQDPSLFRRRQQINVDGRSRNFGGFSPTTLHLPYADTVDRGEDARSGRSFRVSIYQPEYSDPGMKPWQLLRWALENPEITKPWMFHAVWGTLTFTGDAERVREGRRRAGRIIGRFDRKREIPPERMEKLIRLAMQRASRGFWYNYLNAEGRNGNMPLPIAFQRECRNCHGNGTEGVNYFVGYCVNCIRAYGMCGNCGERLAMSTGDYASAPHRWHRTNHRGRFCQRCADIHQRIDTLLGIQSSHLANPVELLKQTHPKNNLDPELSRRKNGNQIRFGVELELEIAEQNADDDLRRRLSEKIMDAFQGRAIAKPDGTVRTGFEICTVPMTLQGHRGVWQDVMQIEEWKKMKAADNTGMHVHSSLYDPIPGGKEYLIELPKVARYMQFVNAYCNRQWVHGIAGRPGNNYTRYHEDMSYAEALEICVKRQLRGSPLPWDRYGAVTLPLTHPTVETRIFASSTNVDTILGRLDFVSAGLEYARQAKVDALMWPQFWQWVQDHSSVYPFLHKLVIDKRLDKRVEDASFWNSFRKTHVRKIHDNMAQIAALTRQAHQ